MSSTCTSCGRTGPPDARFCSHCGRTLSSPPVHPQQGSEGASTLNLPILYAMTAVLILAVLFPPWEAPPSETPKFLGLHPFWDAPSDTAVVSRMLLTIETMTIAIGGMYASWLFRKGR